MSLWQIITIENFCSCLCLESVWHSKKLLNVYPPQLCLHVSCFLSPFLFSGSAGSRTCGTGLTGELLDRSEVCDTVVWFMKLKAVLLPCFDCVELKGQSVPVYPVQQPGGCGVTRLVQIRMLTK